MKLKFMLSNQKFAFLYKNMIPFTVVYKILKWIQKQKLSI